MVMCSHTGPFQLKLQTLQSSLLHFDLKEIETSTIITANGAIVLFTIVTIERMST